MIIAVFIGFMCFVLLGALFNYILMRNIPKFTIFALTSCTTAVILAIVNDSRLWAIPIAIALTILYFFTASFSYVFIQYLKIKTSNPRFKKSFKAYLKMMNRGGKTTDESEKISALALYVGGIFLLICMITYMVLPIFNSSDPAENRCNVDIVPGIVLLGENGETYTSQNNFTITGVSVEAVNRGDKQYYKMNIKNPSAQLQEILPISGVVYAERWGVVVHQSDGTLLEFK